MFKRLAATMLLCLSATCSGQIATDIAHLRALVDGINFLPTDTTNLFTVTGVVTTHVNLTSAPNVLLNLQDSTAAISLFWNGGANNFVPAAGDTIQVTAPLGHASGLLELRATNGNPQHAVLLQSTGDALPEPTPLDFKWKNDAATIELQESKYVVASNVFLDLSGAVFTAGSTLNLTNTSGDLFTLRIDEHTDIGGQPKPSDAVTIFGVLSQSDSSNPRTSGYQLLPTRFADLLSASKAPAIRFTNVLENLIRPGDLPTNTFTEHVLRAGERLTMQVSIADPDGKAVSILPLAGNLPPTAEWDIPADFGTDLAATLKFEPIASDGGKNYTVSLAAWNDVATNIMTWTVYVPVHFEQQIIISEFLANPTANTNLAFFNPLHRAPPSTSPTSNDEFIELVNLSGTDVQLQNWTIADAAQVRHRFAGSTTIGSSNAIVVYGGPAVGFVPQLDVPAFPASVSSAGLSLNNTGTEMILIRNARSNLIARVVYTGSDLSASGSIARAPTLDSPFVASASVSSSTATPGRQYDGKLFSQLTIVPARPPDVRFTNVLANLIRPGDAATNSFSEQTLRPGETLTTQVSATDTDGGEVSVAPVRAGLPATTAWQVLNPTGTNATALFTFTPTEREAGAEYVIELLASSGAATNDVRWKIYVPNAVEQQIAFNEFLANPTANTNAAYFNPLHRASPAPNPTSQDEFVEIVNWSDTDVDLQGWTLHDSTALRHRFESSVSLESSNAVVVYGGPLLGFAPELPVPAVPASSGSLSLQNSGTEALLLRNALGQLVARLVYRGGSLSTNGSLTRVPEVNGPFVAHASVSATTSSPGREIGGAVFAGALVPRIRLVLDVSPGQPFVLRWNADTSRTYSVLEANSVKGKFVPLASGLSFASTNGTFQIPPANVSERFFRIGSP